MLWTGNADFAYSCTDLLELVLVASLVRVVLHRKFSSIVLAVRVIE